MIAKTSKNSTFIIFILLLYLIPRGLENTTYVNIDSIKILILFLKKISYSMALAMCLINAIEKKKISVKYLLIIVTVLLYIWYESFVKDRNSLFAVIIFSLLIKENDFDIYIKYFLRTSIIVYFFTIISSLLGLIENVEKVTERLGYILVRSSMGFTYPGQMIMSLIPIVFMYYYRRNVKWVESLFWLLLDFLVYIKCQTIMGTVLIALFIIIYHLIMSIPKIRNVILLKSKWLKYIPIISFLITILFVYLKRINNIMGIIIDLICNGRFNVSNIIIDSYGIKLFGTNFVNNQTYYYEILDSEYLLMLVGPGIIYTFICLLLGIVLMEYSQSKKNYKLSLILVCCFINAIVNNGIFNIVMNPFILLLVPAIKNKLQKRICL